jgi:phosphoribosylformylglycinamidine synthase II
MAKIKNKKKDPKTAEEIVTEYNLNLTPEEMAEVMRLLDREPSKTEAFIFDVAWSEHCSYKSSRWALKRYLPTNASNVVLGPGEDAGVVRVFRKDGVGKCIVVAHESHNHPSQVLPVEGAATGIGGIVRDVYCMGADVVGCLDPLRFGDPDGEHGHRTRSIARGVVDGIWRYANPIGVPNLGGDVYFDACYDDNCLVNVIALGIIDENKIVRSAVPRIAHDVHYFIMVVGKPTDDTGVGGASFASAVLDDEAAESRSAVQVHDPFLKRVLTEANKEMLDRARKRGIEIGWKDTGAGGLAGATSELASAGDLGAKIDLDRVPLAIDGLPPEIIAVAETQERYVMTVPAFFADEFSEIYNEMYDLPRVFPGACAAVIGEIIREPVYEMVYGAEVVASIPMEAFTKGPSHIRRMVPANRPAEPEGLQTEPEEPGKTLLELLATPNLCSRRPVFDHYDRNVQGNTAVEAGEADAGVIAPWHGSRRAVAAAADGNPYVTRLDPYAGGANAVLEAVRNVAAAGAAPICATDCLNFGNPEEPEIMWSFVEAVRGIGDACRAIGLRGSDGDPLPVVSGNVSFYNQSEAGAAVYPSPVVCVFGYLDDVDRATASYLQFAGDALYLVGRRWGEMGASAAYRLNGRWGKPAPRPRFEDERHMLEAILEINETLLNASCHDVSDGGLAVCLAEMVLGPSGAGRLGADIDLTGVVNDPEPEEIYKALFCENGGYVVEMHPGCEYAAELIFEAAGVDWWRVGKVIEDPRLIIYVGGKPVVSETAETLAEAWADGLRGIFK